MTELRKFVIPELVWGWGARMLVGVYVRNLAARGVVRGSEDGGGAVGGGGEVGDLLRREGMELAVYRAVSPNPRLEEVEEGFDLYREEACDLIVAVGGGSPMDCAKAIGVLAANEGPIRRYVGVDRVGSPTPPLVFLPTTAGSGSEVSQFAVLSDLQTRSKKVLVSRTLVPDVALVDPQMTTSMGPELTLHTGMDALTHALEALVSNASSPLTEVHALEACRLVEQHLQGALDHPREEAHRQGMAMASLQAAMAFSNASLGVGHALAHSLGGWLDLAHGALNARLLTSVIRCNATAASDQYRKAARAMGVETATGVEGVSALMGRVEHWERQMEPAIQSLVLDPDDEEQVIRAALDDPCLLTNPVDVGEEDLRQLLRALN